MQRILVEKTGSVTVVEVPVPEPGPGEVRVQTTYAGICGSDTHAAAGHHPLLPPPYYPGHEVAGIVDAVGQGVDGALVGRRIMLKPNVPCGQCVTCVAGDTNACQTLAWIGCDPSGALPGGMAEYFVAPAKNVYPVPDSVTDRQAALIECLATPVHAARLAGDLTGRAVVVMGAGTIGALQLIAALEAGAAKVVVTDLEESKLRRAIKLGATAAVNGLDPEFGTRVRELLGGPADVIFDCVAAQASANQWLDLVRRGTTICIVGVPSRDYTLPMPYIQDWELRVQGSANYNERDVEVALSLAGKIPADMIISAVYPLTEGSKAFAEAAEFTSGKVLVSGN